MDGLTKLRSHWVPSEPVDKHRRRESRRGIGWTSPVAADRQVQDRVHRTVVDPAGAWWQGLRREGAERRRVDAHGDGVWSMEHPVLVVIGREVAYRPHELDLVWLAAVAWSMDGRVIGGGVADQFDDVYFGAVLISSNQPERRPQALPGWHFDARCDFAVTEAQFVFGLNAT